MQQLFRTSISRIALIYLVTSVVFPCTLRAAAAAKTVDIAEARALPVGSTVTIKGTVTVASGTFASSFFDEGFAVQDKSAGIYVSLPTNVGVEIRDQVEVTGTVQDSFGLLILVPAGPEAIKEKGHGQRVQPAPVRTGAIGETTEGLLVVVEGVITQGPISDLPFGYKLLVDDGSGAVQIFINLGTGIDVNGLAMGQHVRVIGFSSQFDIHYEIDPRQPSDITVLP